MPNNELVRLSRIILLISIIFFILSGYYFSQPKPQNTCYSGCDNDFSFIINPLKGFGGTSTKTEKTPEATLEEIANDNLCPQVCFIPKHPLFYLFFDISFVLSMIRGIIILIISRNKKNEQH